QQVAASQQVQRAVFDGLRTGWIGPFVEDGHFVEHVPRSQQPQHLLATTRRRLEELESTCLDDIQDRGRRAFEQNDLSSRVAALEHCAAQRGQVVFRQISKKRRLQ